MVSLKGKAPDAVQGRRSVQCCCLLLLVAAMLALSSPDRLSDNLMPVQTEKVNGVLPDRTCRLRRRRLMRSALHTRLQAMQRHSRPPHSSAATSGLLRCAWLVNEQLLHRSACKTNLPWASLLDPTNTAVFRHHFLDAPYARKAFYTL